MSASAKQINSGFTLIELMVTVAILAITASLAAPSFREILAAQRVRSTAYSIVSDLTLARSEAVKRGADVTLTPVATQWANGWLVTVVSSAEVLSTQGSAGNGVAFTIAPTGVTFDRNGRINSSTVVRFQLSDGSTRMRCISLDPSGRPKSVTTECPT
ncbi:MAG TPA: GspH/FimT family pseudopilin [Rhodoferax sp.]